MPISEVSPKKYECDHCGYVVYDDPLKEYDRSAKLDFSVQFEYQGYGGIYWLCGKCTTLLEEFLKER